MWVQQRSRVHFGRVRSWKVQKAQLTRSSSVLASNAAGGRDGLGEPAASAHKQIAAVKEPLLSSPDSAPGAPAEQKYGPHHNELANRDSA